MHRRNVAVRYTGTTDPAQGASLSAMLPETVVRPVLLPADVTVERGLGFVTILKKLGALVFSLIMLLYFDVLPRLCGFSIILNGMLGCGRSVTMAVVTISIP